MEFLYGEGCCAILQIDNLSHHRTAKAAMKEFCGLRQEEIIQNHRDNYGEEPDEHVANESSHSWPLVIFTGASGRPLTQAVYAARFRDYIIENGLGTVTQLVSVKNPNSGRWVTMYVWTPDYAELRAWMGRNRR